MESLQDKLDRTQGDLNKIVELYDFAEKLYPYDRIRGPIEVIKSTIHLFYIVE